MPVWTQSQVFGENQTYTLLFVKCQCFNRTGLYHIKLTNAFGKPCCGAHDYQNMEFGSITALLPIIGSRQACHVWH